MQSLSIPARSAAASGPSLLLPPDQQARNDDNARPAQQRPTAKHRRSPIRARSRPTKPHQSERNRRTDRCLRRLGGNRGVSDLASSGRSSQPRSWQRSRASSSRSKALAPPSIPRFPIERVAQSLTAEATTETPKRVLGPNHEPPRSNQDAGNERSRHLWDWLLGAGAGPRTPRQPAIPSGQSLARREPPTESIVDTDRSVHADALSPFRSTASGARAADAATVSRPGGR